MATKKAETKSVKGRLPDGRERFHVSEVAAIVAELDGRNTDTVRGWIYRQIENGSIRAVRVVGKLMVPRAEAVKIVEGVAYGEDAE